LLYFALLKRFGYVWYPKRRGGAVCAASYMLAALSYDGSNSVLPRGLIE
jgi:hypothetical protein